MTILIKSMKEIIRLSSVLETASKICHQHGIEKYRWQIIKLPDESMLSSDMNQLDLYIDNKKQICK